MMEPVYRISSSEDDEPGPSKKLKPNEPISDIQSKPLSLSDFPGNKCVYVNCGKTRRDNPTLKKYKFPKDKALQKQWAINSGNLSLSSLTPESLHRKTVCSEHFDDSDFVNPKIKRVFKKGTVPKPYDADSLPLKYLLSVKGQEEVQSDKEVDNEVYEALNEPEIKVETNVNKANDPLQLIGPPHAQYNQHKPSLRTATQIGPVSKDSALKVNVPIVLRKVVKPPELFLKDVKHVQSYQIRDVSKLTSSIPTATVTVDNSNQQNKPVLILHTTATTESVQAKIVGDAANLENVLGQNENDESENKGKERDKRISQIKGTEFDKPSDQSQSNTGCQSEAKNLPAIDMKDISTDRCTYLGCKFTKKNSYVTFYKFPTDYDSAIKWIGACSRSDILFNQTRKDISRYASDSIGVCFHHKNAIQKKLGTCKETGNRSIQEKQLFVKDDDDMTKTATTNSETETDENSSDSNQSINIITYFPTREYCAFVNCSTFIREPVKKYRFPADQELLAQWIDAAGIHGKLLEVTLRTLFVCAKHFNPDQYTEMGTLILSSVPTPHTEFVDSSPHEGNEHWANKQLITKSELTKAKGLSPTAVSSSLLQPARPRTTVVSSSLLQPARSVLLDKKIRSRSEPKCIVEHCPSNIITNHFYRFPELDPPKFIKWIKALEGTSSVKPNLIVAYRDKMICDIHFEKKFQIGNTLLTDDALPSLFLLMEPPEEGKSTTKKDTSVVWQERSSDVMDTDIPNPGAQPPEEGISTTKRDTSVVWQERNSDVMDTDIPNPKAPHIKGNAILREDGIEFPNIGRELKFGTDCPKWGYLKRFPYKVHRMTRNSNHSRETEAINPGHKIQIHTAIIVDDDDQAEQEAIKLISKIIMENAKSLPPVRKNKRKAPVTKTENV